MGPTHYLFKQGRMDCQKGLPPQHNGWSYIEGYKSALKTQKEPRMTIDQYLQENRTSPEGRRAINDAFDRYIKEKDGHQKDILKVELERVLQEHLGDTI